jgi:hypothetical protein
MDPPPRDRVRDLPTGHSPEPLHPAPVKECSRHHGQRGAGVRKRQHRRRPRAGARMHRNDLDVRRAVCSLIYNSAMNSPTVSPALRMSLRRSPGPRTSC